MKEEYVQFYRFAPGVVRPDKWFYVLNNGFSYIENEINSNITWQRCVRKDEPQDEFPDDVPGFIPKAETVYVSCWYWFNILTVCDWARTYPDVKFVIGGPAIWPTYTANYITEKEWPKNVELKFGLAEQLIGRPVDLNSWTLQSFPLKDHKWVFSYHLDNDCYWAKCSFCNYAGREWPKDPRGYDLKPLHDALAGSVVYLVTMSLRPSMVSILTELNWDKFYCVYIRGDKSCYDAVANVGPLVSHPGNVALMCGIEFPSNRMLARMGKGVTIEELANFINLSRKLGFRMRLSYICGWPDLEEEDLTDAAKFFSMIEDKNDTGIFHSCRRLVVRDDRYKMERVPIIYDKLAVGYFLKLSQKQKDLDEKWKNLLRTRHVKFDFRYKVYIKGIPIQNNAD